MNNTGWKAARERAADAWAKQHRLPQKLPHHKDSFGCEPEIFSFNICCWTRNRSLGHLIYRHASTWLFSRCSFFGSLVELAQCEVIDLKN